MRVRVGYAESSEPPTAVETPPVPVLDPAATRPAVPGARSAGAGAHRKRAGLRSWLLVTPVDLATVVLPAVWAPEHLKALGCLAVLAAVLVTNGRRYRTRLHISVLDELPFLLTRLFAAAAVVATVTALRHEQESVTSFLVAAVCA